MPIAGSILNLVETEEVELTYLERQFIYKVGRVATNDELHSLAHWGPHCLRVARWVYLIAVVMGATDTYAHKCIYAAYLHDWGKLHELMVDLFKHKRKFTSAEREQAKAHDFYGTEMLRFLQGQLGYDDETLEEIRKGQLTHHQPYNQPMPPDVYELVYPGRPYERKIKKGIPFIGRLLKVADFYDASRDPERSYKRPLSSREACLYLLRNAGKEFDPDIVYAFVYKVLRKDYWFEPWQIAFCYREINLRNFFHRLRAKIKIRRITAV